MIDLHDYYIKQETAAKYGKLYWTFVSVCYPCHAEEGLPRRVSINKRIDDYGRTEMHDRARTFGSRFCPH